MIPYKIYLALDVLVRLVALSSPWPFGFADVPAARNFALVAGLFKIFAGTCSKTEEMPAGKIRATNDLGA